MGKRTIIQIDESKCDGCGLCITSCAEGALQLIDGKAKLVRDSYCDGLGNCLGECPQGAITLIEREAADYDEAAVEAHIARQKKPAVQPPCESGGLPLGIGGCPGSAARSFTAPAAMPAPTNFAQSHLRQWPVQLMLVPPGAPFLNGADILVCADCVPFAVPDFHTRYLSGHAVLVGCPKLDDLNHYLQKLAMIFEAASPASITVLKMEVPCCNGIAHASIQARNQSASSVPLSVHTIGIRGDIQIEDVPGCQAAG
jgi:ferredoxin